VWITCSGIYNIQYNIKCFFPESFNFIHESDPACISEEDKGYVHTAAESCIWVPNTVMFTHSTVIYWSDNRKFSGLTTTFSVTPHCMNGTDVAIFDITLVIVTMVTENMRSTCCTLIQTVFDTLLLVAFVNGTFRDSHL